MRKTIVHWATTIVMSMILVMAMTTPQYLMASDKMSAAYGNPASDKIVKIGVFGGTISHQDGAYANANKQVENTTEKAWNVACITNSVAGVVDSLS